MKDPRFRAQLIDNPRGAIAAMGVQLPHDLQVEIIQFRVEATRSVPQPVKLVLFLLLIVRCAGLFWKRVRVPAARPR